MIVACLLPLPTTAQAQIADERAPVQTSGFLFNPVEPAGVFGSTRGCDMSPGGFRIERQAAQQSNGPVKSHIRSSLANLNDRAITTVARQGSYHGWHGHRSYRDLAVMGLVFGAVAGFVAGGVIGAEVSANNCHCTDAELHGFIIGAPIGMVVGGLLGFAIATH